MTPGFALALVINADETSARSTLTRRKIFWNQPTTVPRKSGIGLERYVLHYFFIFVTSNVYDTFFIPRLKTISRGGHDRNRETLVSFHGT